MPAFNRVDFKVVNLFKPLDLTTNIVLARVARESYNQTVSYYLERPRVVQCSLRREALARQRAWLIQKHERGSLEHTQPTDDRERERGEAAA